VWLAPVKRLSFGPVNHTFTSNDFDAVYVLLIITKLERRETGIQDNLEAVAQQQQQQKQTASMAIFCTRGHL